MTDSQPNATTPAETGGGGTGPSNLVLAQSRDEVKTLRNQLADVQAYLRNTTLRGRCRGLARRVLGVGSHPLRTTARARCTSRRGISPRSRSRTRRSSPSSRRRSTRGGSSKQTIRSVLDQNYPRLEYAVQDGGSKDESVAVMEKYRDRLVHIESRKDNGPGPRHQPRLRPRDPRRDHGVPELRRPAPARQPELRGRVLRRATRTWTWSTATASSSTRRARKSAAGSCPATRTGC